MNQIFKEKKTKLKRKVKMERNKDKEKQMRTLNTMEERWKKDKREIKSEERNVIKQREK